MKTKIQCCTRHCSGAYASLALAVGLWFSCPVRAQAQVQARRHLVQFTGMVVSGDSLVGVPDALVSVLKSNRSTTTNAAGYFSLVVFAGDSVAVRSRGSLTYADVPANYHRQSYAALIQLNQRAGVLSLAQPPLPTFRNEFLNLKLPPAMGGLGIQDESGRTYLRKALDRMKNERETDEKRQSIIR